MDGSGSRPLLGGLAHAQAGNPHAFDGRGTRYRGIECRFALVGIFQVWIGFYQGVFNHVVIILYSSAKIIVFISLKRFLAVVSLPLNSRPVRNMPGGLTRRIVGRR